MKDERIPVNDGGGLYDNVGLIDTLTVDCNDVTRLLVTGHYIAFCAKMVEIVKKLSLLREGVEHDISDRDRQIKELQSLLDGKGVVECSTLKDL